MAKLSELKTLLAGATARKPEERAVAGEGH